MQSFIILFVVEIIHNIYDHKYNIFKRENIYNEIIFKIQPNGCNILR